MNERKINTKMLMLARHAAAMTQEEVSIAIGVSQSKYAKFELQQLVPNAEEVKALAKALEEPEEFFFLDEVELGPGSTCRSYLRHRRTMPAGDMKQIVAMVNKVRIRVARLFDGVHVDGPGQFECIDVDSMNGDVDAIAAAVRVGWRLPPGPIADLTRVVEDRGIAVVRCQFGSDKIDAMSQTAPGSPAVVCVNAGKSGEVTRFALAHEIGHLVMHSLGCGENAEEEADRFGAALLTPADEIRPEFGRSVTLTTLSQLKSRWRVPMKALVLRANRIGVLSDQQAKWLYITMNKMGWAKGEPFPIQPEQPRIVRELIDFRMNGQGLGVHGVCGLMPITEDRLRTEFMGESRRLRLTT